MTAATATVFAARTRDAAPGPSHALSALRAYFASDSRRTIQTVLGLIWLLDAGLQLQSFMYSQGFIQMVAGMRGGQPSWLASSMAWGTRIAHGDLGVWNTLFALVQFVIAFGILFRPTVKPALALSFVWAPFVWLFGEGLGMLLAGSADPLTGAPGAVVLYLLIGLIAWPNDRPGGLLGARGARIAWAALWIFMAYLWLLPANSSSDAVSSAIASAPTGMRWLSSLETSMITLTSRNGELIALVLAATSVLIGVAVAADWHARAFLWLAIYLSIVYWVIGQGLGGIATGGGTDPNAGPLFVLLAATIYTLLPAPQASPSRAPVPIAT